MSHKPIIVVSGLPRSGTSMMMQMLQAGGLPIVSDGIRAPDEHNPRGYFELESVKAIHESPDLTWLEEAGGKAIKIISFLLGWLPETNDYQVVFMRRDLREIVASQQKMLAKRGAGDAPTGPDDARRVTEIYARHLEDVSRLIAARRCFSALDVEYGEVLNRSHEEARRIAHFLGSKLNIEAMAAAVDSSLYRNRAV